MVPLAERTTSGGAIVDASVTAAWCFEDETSAFTEAVLDHVVRHGARVPALWIFEMTNVLAMAERRGRVRPGQARRLLDGLLALPMVVDHRELTLLGPDLIRLARANRMTAYDAAYLELAMRTDLPLATRDTTLQQAAARLGVAPFSPP